MFAPMIVDVGHAFRSRAYPENRPDPPKDEVWDGLLICTSLSLSAEQQGIDLFSDAASLQLAASCLTIPFVVKLGYVARE